MTNLDIKTLQTIYDALEILNENDAENISCYIGSDWDIEYLKETIEIAPSTTGNLDEYEIEEIETYVNRHDALNQISQRISSYWSKK
jgi:nitric oxide reductase large subunit